ncbi:thioesterase family protein [Mogibacterium neglectum]|uniref:thioesterase family protein n=1 Tax=Mogibacterium neglectum TaxID=114528 RepID=UPI00272B5146|nr:thioesterase family protein [Mogibacterium neglectum]WLD75969.1 thioesterase family protein [Mogibacterium neglectum]
MDTGIKGFKEIIVTKELTARSMGSGDLEVYATPAMVALMEGTAADSVKSELDEGKGSVGTSIKVKHLAATPIGMRVRCESELIEASGRRLVFRVSAFDEKDKIGEGTHERFIISNDKFQSKANSKLSE